jgi:hypothetical protein
MRKPIVFLAFAAWSCGPLIVVNGGGGGGSGAGGSSANGGSGNTPGIGCTSGTHDCTCMVTSSGSFGTCNPNSVSSGQCCADDNWPTSGICKCSHTACSMNSANNFCDCSNTTAGSGGSCPTYSGGVCCNLQGEGKECYCTTVSHCNYSADVIVSSCSADTLDFCGPGQHSVSSCSQ